MKLVLASCLLLGLCFAAAKAVPNFNMDEKLSPEDLKRLEVLMAQEMKLHNMNNKLGAINYEVLFNDYLDKIFAKVRSLIVANQLDPTTLFNQYVNIGIGYSNLTEGQLNDTSTVERYENVTLAYNSESKILEAEMVLRFEDLKFLYKYHTIVTLISMTGHMHGDIEHIHIHVKLGFDFAQALVFVDSIDFKHTGDISVWFSGNSLIDWITNAMSAVITGILHELILDTNIADKINSIVDSVNEILHPSSGVF